MPTQRSAPPQSDAPSRARSALRTTARRDQDGAAAPAGNKQAGRPDIAGTLRSRIATHELPPGSKLAESELALEFSVPRSRVREALAVLEQRGLVERIPNRGAVVMRLEPSLVASLYDIREVLEGLCARLATLHGQRERWQHALTHFKGPMVAHVAAGRLDDYIRDYEAFRTEMVEASANPVLREMLDSILERTQMLIRRIIILPGRAELGLAEHTAVLEAMVAGDADRAEALRRQNMRSARTFFERYQKYIL